MDAPESSGFLGQVLAWIAAGIAGLGAWLWINTMGRIQLLEADKVGREEFNKHIAKVDKDRDERREVEIKLFDKLDGLKDLIIERTK